MDLIFFDLDGTLLNKSSKISSFTRDTLDLLKKNNIANTVATGRSMLSAKRVIGNYSFDLPHIYTNGVAIWNPQEGELTLDNLLNNIEIESVIDSAVDTGLAPFVTAVCDDHQHIVFHGKPVHNIENELAESFYSNPDVHLKPLSALTDDCQVTNISMIGETAAIEEVFKHIDGLAGLIAYSGPADESEQFSWIDIHHHLATKGRAVEDLKAKLGASNVICFGDSYNDLSMFEIANESYAPANAKDEVKALANEVIGHHHEDGVAVFLRERFSL